MNTRKQDLQDICRRPWEGKPAAVVVASYYPWDPRVHRATSALASAGMAIDLYCLQESRDQPLQETVEGVEVYRLRLTRHRKGKLRYLFEYLSFFLWAFWKLTVASLRKRYDLVHVHNLPNMLVFSSLLPKLRGAKVILDMHDPMPELCRTLFNLTPDHPLIRLTIISEKLSTRYADLVLSPNQAFHELFALRTGFPAKFQIIMNSPSDKIFPYHPYAALATVGATSDPRPFRLMFHGLIAERHGLDVLIAAVKLLSCEIPSLRLDIYGRQAPYLEEVLKLIDEQGVTDQVRYQGMKSLEEIAQIIETIDLGIIPNKRTPFTEINFPTRIFEYLTLGKPVIVPTTHGIQDYFRDDEIFYFIPDDASSLARTIKWVYDHPDETRQTVERGIEVYRQHLWTGEKGRFLTMVAHLIVSSSVALM